MLQSKKMICSNDLCQKEYMGCKKKICDDCWRIAKNEKDREYNRKMRLLTPEPELQTAKVKGVNKHIFIPNHSALAFQTGFFGFG